MKNYVSSKFYWNFEVSNELGNTTLEQIAYIFFKEGYEKASDNLPKFFMGKALNREAHRGVVFFIIANDEDEALERVKELSQKYYEKHWLPIENTSLNIVRWKFNEYEVVRWEFNEYEVKEMENGHIISTISW